MNTPGYPLRNSGVIRLADLPVVDTIPFLQSIIDATDQGWRIAAYFGASSPDGLLLICVLASDTEGSLAVSLTTIRDGHLPSIASLCPQAQLFEREIAEQCGVTVEDHPWLKPVRFHAPFITGPDKGGTVQRSPVGVMDYYRVEGDAVHEVAVGPVHAGVIEPGHFRFQCHGEEVFHLEISLGYQHRGIEAALMQGPHPATLRMMEAIAGDTTIGHGQAYCMIMEALGGTKVPPRAEVMRGIALELERLANHTGDLGAIAGDVGFLPTASFCGRIRGDFLNMSAVLCGSRFGRGLLIPGGTVFDLDQHHRDDLLKRLDAARRELTDAIELLFDTPSVMARLEGTGALTTDQGRKLGLVGPAARACGLKRDVRNDHPFGIYRMTNLPVATCSQGDVAGRALIRWQEAQKSLSFIEEQLRQMPVSGHRVEVAPPGRYRLAVALTEGWRGEICHVALTDEAGRFLRYKVVDPSFHNWQGLAMVLRGEQISDFPLCNKSFNLSYCGFDL